MTHVLLSITSSIVPLGPALPAQSFYCEAAAASCWFIRVPVGYTTEFIRVDVYLLLTLLLVVLVVLVVLLVLLLFSPCARQMSDAGLFSQKII